MALADEAASAKAMADATVKTLERAMSVEPLSCRGLGIVAHLSAQVYLHNSNQELHT